MAAYIGQWDAPKPSDQTDIDHNPLGGGEPTCEGGYQVGAG
jgi:hypothetical protein